MSEKKFTKNSREFRQCYSRMLEVLKRMNAHYHWDGVRTEDRNWDLGVDALSTIKEAQALKDGDFPFGNGE